MNKKNTVLIVEDEIVNIEILRELLENDYSLKIAENGVEALELMNSEPPDLVLLDMILPDILGLDLCVQFKENEPTRHIPIIIVTTLKNKEDKLKGLEAGANDYLFKPIDKDELLLKVKNHLVTKNLNDQLNDSFQNIVILNDISAHLMSNFNPSYFDFNTNLFQLLKDYTVLIEDLDQLPSYILTSVKNGKSSLDSTLYKLDGRELKQVHSNIQTDNFEKYEINKNKLVKDVIFQNMNEKDDGFLEFQQLFHAEVQK